MPSSHVSFEIFPVSTWAESENERHLETQRGRDNSPALEAADGP